MGRIIALLFLGACWSTAPRPIDEGPCSSTESKTECPADYKCISNRCTLLPGADEPCVIQVGCQEGFMCTWKTIREAGEIEGKQMPTERVRRCADSEPIIKCWQACREENPGGKAGRKGPGSAHDRGACMRNCP